VRLCRFDGRGRSIFGATRRFSNGKEIANKKTTGGDRTFGALVAVEVHSFSSRSIPVSERIRFASAFAIIDPAVFASLAPISCAICQTEDAIGGQHIILYLRRVASLISFETSAHNEVATVGGGNRYASSKDGD
jgi:hypothetical protein